MFANFLIGLREGLEASLIIGILVAYLVKTGRQHRVREVWLGVAVAVCVSLAFGAALTFGPRSLSEATQEAIGGMLSIIAAGLVTWMIFWMAKTARHLKTNLQGRLDTAIEAGKWALVGTAFLAVGREGLETALFLWAGAQTAGSSTTPLLGATLGLAAAVVLGWAIYQGALKLDLRRFFGWTGLFLIIIAAGVLSYGVGDLQEAGILPGSTSLAFDVSGTIPPASWYGTLLRGTVNFSATPTVLQAVAWTLYIVPVLTIYVRTVWFNSHRSTPTLQPEPVAAPNA